MTELPQTRSGRELRERTGLAAGALTSILREAGLTEYDLRNWMPTSEEIRAIEREAGAQLDGKILVQILSDLNLREAAFNVHERIESISEQYRARIQEESA